MPTIGTHRPGGFWVGAGAGVWVVGLGAGVGRVCGCDGTTTGAVGMPVVSGTLTGALARADGIVAVAEGEAAVDGAVGAGLTPEVGVALAPPCAPVEPGDAGCAEGTAQTVGAASSASSVATPGLGSASVFPLPPPTTDSGAIRARLNAPAASASQIGRAHV